MQMESHLLDKALLRRIAQSTDEAARNAAFDAFYRRHQGFLWSVLSAVCHNDTYDDEVKREVLQNTFYNVFRYAASFTANPEATPEEVTKNVQGWLIKIAKREYQDILKDRVYPAKREKEAFEGMHRSSRTRTGTSFEKELILEALEQLNERDCHILRTYFSYYEPGKGSQALNLPDGVLDDLTRLYGIKKENLRQIISRSKKAVKKYIEEKSQLANRTLSTKRDEPQPAQPSPRVGP
jgi:RNA polymerase sigma factor (sigma-70 family)